MSTVFIEKWCVQCHQPTTLELDANDVRRWRSGEHAQDVWPHLTDNERELIISGTHPKCWVELWKDKG